jgi:hypothetical protein
MDKKLNEKILILAAHPDEGRDSSHSLHQKASGLLRKDRA